jgi:hypothetical protein
MTLHLSIRAVPIPFAPLIGLALGAALAWIAAPELSRDDGPIALSRSFLIVAAFAALVWLPVVGYFVGFHGDWAYLYVVPWQRVPSAVDMVLVVLSAAAVVGGFVLAVPAVRKRRHAPVIALIVVPLALAAASFMVAAHRLAVSGTYAQFHGDFGTEPIAASTLGKGVLFMGAVLALAVAWTVRALLRIATS